MSRIGKLPIELPQGVEVKIEGHTVTVKGPLGTEVVEVRPEISVKVEDNHVVLTPNNDERKTNALHGLMRTLVANAVKGVKDGFEKKLEAVGVGYRFALKGNQLVITAGFSHPVEVDIPEGIKLESPSNTELFIRGIDKCLVGEYAANIRKIRKPEPYKGKGIRYSGEVIRRKVGKKAA